MLKPTKDWVLTERVYFEEKNPGIIQLVKTKESEPTKFVKLLDFGPNANKHKHFSVGDVVLVLSKTGIKVQNEDKEYEMAKEFNFLCKREED